MMSHRDAVQPDERASDLQPLLDQELSRLPDKYRKNQRAASSFFVRSPWFIDVGGEYHYSSRESQAFDVVTWSDGLHAVEVIYCNGLVFGKTLVSLRAGTRPSLLDRLREWVRPIR